MALKVPLVPETDAVAVPVRLEELVPYLKPADEGAALRQKNAAWRVAEEVVIPVATGWVVTLVPWVPPTL